MKPPGLGETQALWVTPTTAPSILAIGHYNYSVHSPDGITWTRGNVRQQQCTFVQDMNWDGSRWLAACTSGKIISSTDGDTWSDVAGITSQAYLRSIHTHEGVTLAVGDSGRILRSANGTDWTSTSLSSRKDRIMNRLTDVYWLNNQWVITSIEDSCLYFSADGIQWTDTIPFYGMPNTITGNGTTLITAGFLGSLMTQQGTHLNDNINTGIKVSLNDVVWTGSRFVAVGDSGFILRSTDGINWTSSQPNARTKLSCIVWTGTQLVVGTEYGIFISDNQGDTWTSYTHADKQIIDIAWSGERFVAIGNTRKFWTSTNATSWTGTNDIFFPASTDQIEWTGTRFVFADNNGTIQSSVDGITWETSDSYDFDGEWFKSIAVHGDSVLVVGSDSLVVISTDGGATWPIQHKESTYLSLNAMQWTGDRFLGVGGYGRTMQSTQGTNWQKIINNVQRDMYSMAQNNDRIVAVGLGGMIVTMEKIKLSENPVWVAQTLGKGPSVQSLQNRPRTFDLLGRIQR